MPTDKTTLHSAATFGNVEATKILLQHGAEPNQIDQFGDTPLIVAHKNKYPAIAIALVEVGAIIDKGRLNLKLLLFVALKLQSAIAIGGLIRAGADDSIVQNEERR